MKRVFIDALASNSNSSEVQFGYFNKASEDGNTLVVPNTFIDMEVFQDFVEWFEEKLQYGEIVIQMFHDLDQMVSKPFYWSSLKLTTEAFPSFLECWESMKSTLSGGKCSDIGDMAMFAGIYGLRKEEWKPGEYVTPEPLCEEDCATLGLASNASRTDVLAACKKQDRMDIFNRFNLGFNRGMALQHHCDAIMGVDGKVFDLS